MKLLLLFLSLIPFALQAQEDSVYIFNEYYPVDVLERPFLAQLPVQNIQHYEEGEQVLVYTDTLDFDSHLAWYDMAWFSVPLSEYLNGSSSTLGDVYYLDLTEDGRNEMVAVFNHSQGRSGWQSGYFHQTQWALVWDFTREMCLGVISVSDIYESWWVINSEVFDEDHAHLWENDQEPELEYAGESNYSSLDLSIENGVLVLSPSPIENDNNEYNMDEQYTCTYSIFWNEDKNTLDYTKTCP